MRIERLAKKKQNKHFIQTEDYKSMIAKTQLQHYIQFVVILHLVDEFHLED